MVLLQVGKPWHLRRASFFSPGCSAQPFHYCGYPRSENEHPGVGSSALSAPMEIQLDRSLVALGHFLQARFGFRA
ncbi:MAG: hypothetical protein DMG30_07680 [Acidobacteria bacterium]|nr:MAG: hypothetical protein DMG30_07680 [Acidobacteriota bacterium]